MTPTRREAWIDKLIPKRFSVRSGIPTGRMAEIVLEIARDAMAVADADRIVALKVAGLWDDDHARVFADATRGQGAKVYELQDDVRVVAEGHPYRKPSKLLSGQLVVLASEAATPPLTVEPRVQVDVVANARALIASVKYEFPVQPEHPCRIAADELEAALAHPAGQDGGG